MISYPSILNLYRRDPDTHILTDEFSAPEFAQVNRWLVTEKVDGTNIRVAWDGQSVTYGGRTDAAQIPAPLVAALRDTFEPTVCLGEAFGDKKVVLFGEGYGERIQNGGGYRDGVGFILFDVWVDGWWLSWDDVSDVAAAIGVSHVPLLSKCATTQEVVDMLDGVYGSFPSTLAFLHGKGKEGEGVIARTDPYLFNRRGERVVFKYKIKDHRRAREARFAGASSEA